MTTARLIEALLEGAIESGLCPDLPTAPRPWSLTTGELLPAQYLLLVHDWPRARAALRRAAEGLLALVDAADAAYANGDGDGCGKLRALAAAPAWLQRPSGPDDTDLDVALVWERQVDHGGDWEGLLEALHQAGSTDWQWAIRRCRTLMRFEEEMGIDLAELVGAPTSGHEEPALSKDKTRSTREKLQ
jgi:hypothetical protein